MTYSYTQDRLQLLLRGKKNNERKYLNGKKVPAGLFGLRHDVLRKCTFPPLARSSRRVMMARNSIHRPFIFLLSLSPVPEAMKSPQ